MENNENKEVTVKEGNTAANSFIFKLNGIEEPVIVIDQQGFWYKGELVEDAGEVYKLFKEFIGVANK